MLRGKRAIVTGSTSGIGAGIARALAEAGCQVLLNGFGDDAAIERQRTELSALNGMDVAHHPADISRPEEIVALVAAAESRFGGIDILVNNAGVQHVAPIEEFPVARWDALMAINLSAAFHTIRAALPGMKRRDWGRIINIASAHGLVASAEKAGYVATKFGLVGLTKVVALETARTGITCNAICPGWARTPLVERQLEVRAAQEGVSLERATQDLLREKQPSMRFVEPNDIGAFVVHLCGDSATAITGATLSIDVGWTAG